jgi:hypothetical protein
MDAFDILAAEIDAEEKEGLEKASQLSFTKEEMTIHLQGPDHINPILKGHLYFEHVLITAIRDALQFPDEINIRQLSFPAKLKLAVALGQFPKDMKAAGIFLNDLRNKLAHRLDFKFKQEDHNQFWGTLPSQLRDAVSEFVKERAVDCKEITVHYMLVALIMSAEYFRVARAKERVQQNIRIRHIHRAVKLAEPGMRANGLI